MEHYWLEDKKIESKKESHSLHFNCNWLTEKENKIDLEASQKSNTTYNRQGDILNKANLFQRTRFCWNQLMLKMADTLNLSFWLT
jgi:hypothetical protein